MRKLIDLNAYCTKSSAFFCEILQRLASPEAMSSSMVREEVRGGGGEGWGLSGSFGFVVGVTYSKVSPLASLPPLFSSAM